MVTIQSFPVQTVIDNNKTRFNTNNLWGSTSRPPPSDYASLLSTSSTSNWIAAFHHPDTYSTLSIPPRDVRWLTQAAKIGAITASFPSLYSEELQDAISRLSPAFPPPPHNAPGWFVRTEGVSLKYGCHGVGPYASIGPILESLVTSTDTHAAIRIADDPSSDDPSSDNADESSDTLSELSIFLLPWLPSLDPMMEFRVFVHAKRVVAISQQSLYKPNSRLLSWPEGHVRDAWIRSLVSYITAFYHSDVKPKLDEIAPYENYTFDFAFLGDDDALVPYFIEPHFSVGADYSAGSALFEWTIDADIMEGRTPEIEFRYTTT